MGIERDDPTKKMYFFNSLQSGASVDPHHRHLLSPYPL